MKKSVSWIVNHPVISVIFLIIAIALLMPKVNTLELNSDMEQFLPVGDPQTAYYEHFFKDTFGSDVLSIVVVKPKTGKVFTHETLTLIETLSEEFESIDTVIRVSSLTTVHQIKGEGDSVNTEMLITDIPEDPDELRRIREDALKNDQFLGYIISADARVAAINIYTEKPENEKAFEKKFVDQVTAIIDKHGREDTVMYQVGGPRGTATFLDYIEKDQKTVNIATLVVIVIFLFLAYRTPIAVLLPLLTTGLSTAATFGFLSLMNYPITPYIALVPGLLLVIGSTEDMHFLSCYFHQLRDGLDKKSAIMSSAQQSALPITLTSLTTIVGFSTLALNETNIIRQFGIGMAFGLFANYIATIITIPAVLRLFKVPKAVAATGKDGSPGRQRLNLERLLDWIVRVNRDHAAVIAWITGLLIILALFGFLRVSVDNDYLGFFKENSPIRKDLEKLNQDLSGLNVINVIFSTEDDGDILEPEVLKQIDGLQQFMKQLGTFGKTVSLADHIKLMHREMNEGREEMRRIPDSRPAIAQYLLLMDYDTLAEYVDSERRNARVLVLHNMSGSRELVREMDKVRSYIDKNIRGYGKDGKIRDLSITFTGLDYLMKNSTDAIVKGQVNSLGIALVVIFILMSIVFFSVKGGLIAIISNTIPILINFGIMGWFGIALNTSTCMVALVALGIAIDDTIHFMMRYQRELRLTNDQKQAMANAIKTEGEPVMFTSVALSLGFFTIILSNFVPSIQFGYLSGLVMIYALLTDIFVNPVILAWVQLITIWDYVSVKFKKAVLEQSLIFKNLRHSEAKKVVLLGSIREAHAQELIFHQGDKGEDMFLILSGRVRVALTTEAGGEKVLGVLEQGDIFGEMALLGEGTRTASVIAETDTELLRIDYNSLERVRRRNPGISAKLHMNIARILSERVQIQNIA